MAWGFQTWDGNGVPNNTGIVKVFTTGIFRVESEQVSGSWNAAVPAGYALDYIFTAEGNDFATNKRAVSISGNTISITNPGVNAIGYNILNAQAGWFILFVRKI